MTYQKALDGFKQLHGDIDKNNHLFVGTINPDFVQMAISALEKQIPKAPQFSSDGYDPEGMEVWDAHCPNCEHGLNGDGEEDICPNCGQAILWE